MRKSWTRGENEWRLRSGKARGADLTPATLLHSLPLRIHEKRRNAHPTLLLC